MTNREIAAILFNISTILSTQNGNPYRIRAYRQAARNLLRARHSVAERVAAGQPLGLREVIEEATVEVGEERLSKKPDYELRLARQRKLFVEAKKPNVRIDRSRDAAFQTRRYGYSASLPISILTNFHQLAVYDCRPSPNNTDEAHVARVEMREHAVHHDLRVIRHEDLDPRGAGLLFHVRMRGLEHPFHRPEGLRGESSSTCRYGRTVR